MNIIIGIVILLASFLFAMLGLGGGMVYVPALNWAGYDLITVALPLGLLLNGLNTSFALIQFGKKKTSRLERWGIYGWCCTYCFANRSSYFKTC